ncbi:hypothetical protein PHYPSEUDO_010198 [Phytophthora pseudosyringae]|uniref:Uncharacterized protein n=1 Tax=Phytophthora pseudosyringae TaxID=221518 RepID=A0A8T1WBX0_9STRA|nr:hypothetical protein PHYPSEUDO_010198 [Phytophthora pseudosyringae]
MDEAVAVTVAVAADHGSEEADVWSNFEKSVAYMKEVAALYESAFGCKADGLPSTSTRKTVTKAHVDEAHNQAQQALEMLASNMLNASMTIVNSIEKQVERWRRVTTTETLALTSSVPQESEADRLKHKVSAIQQTIRDRQVVLDQETIHKFYSSHKASQTRASLPTSPAQNSSRYENEQPQHLLKLSLDREQCLQ